MNQNTQVIVNDQHSSAAKAAIANNWQSCHQHVVFIRAGPTVVARDEQAIR